MDRVTDVVIIGFGGAGAAAAIEAADAGADVLILEKSHKPGGATRMSAGIVYAAGSSVQSAAGINDTADEMYSYYVATDNGMKDPALTRVIADRSAETIEWLLKLGADFPPEDMFIGGAERQFAHVTPPKPRSHHFRTQPGESTYSGAKLFTVLEEAVKARKIEVMLQTSATELLTNSRKEVVGVKASSQGRELLIQARRAVILADGGFAKNPEMVKQYLAKWPFVAAGKVILTSHPGQTGDAIRMAMALGADLCGMAPSHANPDAFVPIGIPTPHHNHACLPSIFVNTRGERFANEDLPYNLLSPALDNQDSIVYQIFDDEVAQQVNLSEAKKKHTMSAPTISELAGKLGIPAEKFEATIRHWNRYGESGEDPDFGKTGPTVGPIRTPPFWAGRIRRKFSTNYGGLKTNVHSQVLHVLDGKPILRLYAAGQTTGGRFGSFSPGSGAALADCFVFGRIAGQNAAMEAPLD